MGTCVDELSTEVRNVRGARLADLAHNAIEVADRNLYERSCDVRWWATDGAVVDCVAAPSTEHSDFASHRLAVILNSYTVYLDLWIADVNGRVISTGRPDRYPKAVGQDVSMEQWFREAMSTRDGSCFAVADIHVEPLLNGATVAPYSTAIRENGDATGKLLGVLGIFFDWEAQAQSIVKGVRLTDEEWSRTRCLLIDSQQRVIASSDGKGILKERFPLTTSGQSQGSYESNGVFIGFALTPGYETYAGLGWYGVIIQKA
jgi:C4-dicarboxylate-specific signal transduction histidine kinase